MESQSFLNHVSFLFGFPSLYSGRWYLSIYDKEVLIIQKYSSNKIKKIIKKEKWMNKNGNYATLTKLVKKIPTIYIFQPKKCYSFISLELDEHGPLPVDTSCLFVYSCWRRKMNAWNWSCPGPRWRWLRLRWKRTRCCTAWRTLKSTPAKLSTLSPSLHPACRFNSAPVRLQKDEG